MRFTGDFRGLGFAEFVVFDFFGFAVGGARASSSSESEISRISIGDALLELDLDLGRGRETDSEKVGAGVDLLSLRRIFARSAMLGIEKSDSMERPSTCGDAAAVDSCAMECSP